MDVLDPEQRVDAGRAHLGARDSEHLDRRLTRQDPRGQVGAVQIAGSLARDDHDTPPGRRLGRCAGTLVSRRLHDL